MSQAHLRPSCDAATRLTGLRRRRRAERLLLVLAVPVLVAGCGGARRDPGTASQAPTTTTAAISKPCLRAAEQGKAFRFRTSAGATLVGVVLGSGRTGLVLGHQLNSDLCE
jgi:hypothetical protein